MNWAFGRRGDENHMGSLFHWEGKHLGLDLMNQGLCTDMGPLEEVAALP